MFYRPKEVFEPSFNSKVSGCDHTWQPTSNAETVGRLFDKSADVYLFKAVCKSWVNFGDAGCDAFGGSDDFSTVF